jgi:hypothetical protein
MNDNLEYIANLLKKNQIALIENRKELLKSRKLIINKLDELIKKIKVE